MPRLFIAIPLPPQVLDRLSRVQRQLRPQLPGFRWSHPESMHLTLRFLGEQPDDLVAEIGKIVVCVGSSSPPFQLPLGGLGAFPTPQRARVIWGGVHNLPDMQRLYSELSRQLQRLGIPAEPRPFAPHLTLGRVRHGPVRVTEILAGYGAEPLGSLPVTELVLYQSRLLPNGAEHRPLVAAKIGADRIARPDPGGTEDDG